jgi:hypothetical protein
VCESAEKSCSRETVGFFLASVKPRRAQFVCSCESNRANLNNATFKHSSPCAFYNFNVAIVVEKSHNHHPKSKKVHFRRSNEGVFKACQVLLKLVQLGLLLRILFGLDRLLDARTNLANVHALGAELAVGAAISTVFATFSIGMTAEPLCCVAAARSAAGESPCFGLEFLRGNNTSLAM